MFFCIGLVIPMLLEILEMAGISKSLAMLAPVLVLVGGYALRQVVLDAGQESTWTHYETQYSPEKRHYFHCQSHLLPLAVHPTKGESRSPTLPRRRRGKMIV
jgi:hypothetical protein